MSKISFVALVGFTLVLAPAVLAQQAPTGGPGVGQGRGSALRQACGADVRKLCPNAQDRQDRRQCLTDNKAQLSPDCAAALASAPAPRQ